MKKTKIEWCDSTWNPVTGCWHGCEYCYARKIANRFGKGINAETLNGPYSLSEKIKCNPYPFLFEPTMHRYRLDEPQLWTKPRTIFVCSMADLFGDWVPDDWIYEVFAACEKAPHHRYLFLTKNPRKYCELENVGKLPQKDNFWYGSTLDSMKASRFNGTYRYNTFVSIEPLTERLDVGLGSFGYDTWIIIGAETGNRKEKVTPQKEWVDKICEAADITHMAVFMKDSLIPIVGEENMRREFPW